MERDAELVALYAWTLKCERQLGKFKESFPELLRPDQSRLVASFRALRIGLEFRVYPPYQKGDGLPLQESVPRGQGSDTTGRAG